MLQELELENFRCFPSLKLDFPTPHTLFVGDNAQGKTSILEAVCVLMRLQSPRPGGRREWTRHEQTHFRLAALHNQHRLSVAQDSRERRLKINEEAVANAAEYRSASALVVWMGINDTELVVGAGELRRRYIDFTASQLIPDHARHLKRYSTALRQRNELLRQNPDAAVLDAVTRPLITHGIPLLENRRAIAVQLRPLIAQAAAALSGGRESLDLSFEPGLNGDFDQELARSKSQELRLRQTCVGPHRDDLRLSVDARPARHYASEGQKRTIALALKLGQAALLFATTGRTPLLLMDDIFGELDPTRRRALLAFLPPDTQTLITTTHLDWMDGSLKNTTVRTISERNYH